jgi:hypothetical protein
MVFLNHLYNKRDTTPQRLSRSVKLFDYNVILLFINGAANIFLHKPIKTITYNKAPTS